MSLSVSNVGGTLTGGATVVLALTQNVGNKVSFATPDHTRLAPREVSLSVTPASTTLSDPGVARSALKVSYGDRLTSEGCCSVQSGHVIFDITSRWSLNQPESLVDDAVEMLQALVFNTAFIAALKKGILPQ